MSTKKPISVTKWTQICLSQLRNAQQSKDWENERLVIFYTFDNATYFNGLKPDQRLGFTLYPYCWHQTNKKKQVWTSLPLSLFFSSSFSLSLPLSFFFYPSLYFPNSLSLCLSISLLRSFFLLPLSPPSFYSFALSFSLSPILSSWWW